MTQFNLVYWTLLTGVLSALATGLGAIPVHFLKTHSKKLQAFTTALAAGMMISASVFSLVQKGLDLESKYSIAPYMVIAGLMLGALFVWFAEKTFSHNHNVHLGQLGNGVSRKGIMIFIVMFIHSIPEGIAIGVGFATGDFTFGLIMAIAISVHNIPEGIAISVPLHNEGVSTKKCALFSILSSVPQPVLAVPAALAVNFFEPLLPIGLGFAGGAMIYLVMAEMIPDSLVDGGKTLTSWGVMTGIALMLTITVVLDRIFICKF